MMNNVVGAAISFSHCERITPVCQLFSKSGRPNETHATSAPVMPGISLALAVISSRIFVLDE